MASERWTEVRRLFEEALEIESDRRAGWLAEACRGDVELEKEVEELLAADETKPGTSSLLDEGVPSAVIQRTVSNRMLGTKVGSFRIERIIGAGGMGTVYAAVQDRPQRVVALKMLRLGLGTEKARRRFEYEAEILGRLQHPGIAQVLEAGTYDEGGLEQPYFAMEYIEGARPINQYVQESGLGHGDVLALFGRVCEAVHYGHQRGIIHRDLKPGNVLIDGSGQPKVIDYGIARAEDADPGQASLRTETGDIVGTLEYMSPEQLGAEPDVDTRADVYALGVILYELLTGRPAFDLQGLSLPGAVKALGELSPPRPSAVSDPAVPADLDWIVLKAMEKEPDRRYPSASELEADLQRFLGHEPVQAGPPSATYRLRKFVQRHRLGISAAVFCLLALLAGTVATAIGWSRALKAEEIAELRRQQTERVADTLWEVNNLQIEMLSSVRDRGRDVKLVELLDTAAAGLDRASIHDPPVEAGTRNALGTSYFALGLTSQAREQLEKAQELLQEAPEQAPRISLLVQNSLGMLLTTVGELDSAEALLTEALPGYIEYYGEDDIEVAAIRVNLGNLYYRKGEYETALAHFQDGDRIAVQYEGRGYKAEALAVSGIGLSLQQLGRLDEAEFALQRGFEKALEFLGEEYPSTLAIQNNLALILRDRGRYADAESILRELATVRARVIGESHGKTLTVLNNLAAVYQDQGEFAEAEATFRRILELRRSAGGSAALADLSFRNNLAVVLQRQDSADKIRESEHILLELISDADELLPEGHYLRAQFRKQYGMSLLKQGRLEEAEAAMVPASKALEASLGLEHFRTQRSLQDLVELYETWGKDAEAEEVRKKISGR